ncbi:MAG: hypothetical protein ACO1SX_00155 [Actinomycetota bacterium]
MANQQFKAILEAPPPQVPPQTEVVLERVLVGKASPELAASLLNVTEYELGILLRALIRQRAVEQAWERAA